MWTSFSDFYMDSMPWPAVVCAAVWVVILAFAIGAQKSREGIFDVDLFQMLVVGTVILLTFGIIMWPLVAVLLILAGVFGVFYKIGGGAYRVRARRGRARRAELLKSAAKWREIAGDDAQIADTRKAAKAAAKALEDQAAAVPVLRLNGKG